MLIDRSALASSPAGIVLATALLVFLAVPVPITGQEIEPGDPGGTGAVATTTAEPDSTLAGPDPNQSETDSTVPPDEPPAVGASEGGAIAPPEGDRPPADLIDPGDSLGVFVVPPAVLRGGAAPDSLGLPASLQDSLAAGALGDTLGAGPDSLGAVADTLGVVADSLGVVIAEPEPRPRYIVGVGFQPMPPPVFLRPWDIHNTWRAKGLRMSEPELPGGRLEGTPFRREIVIDHERDAILIVTRVGEHFRRVSYAAPLSAHLVTAGRIAAAEAWNSKLTAELGKTLEQAPGGLLDIDIPMPLGTQANLKVKGSERITFGGQTSYVVEALDTESGPQSRFPQLDMEQQLTVNLEGTIGEKIHVFVDHRSGGDAFGVGKANEIRVHYDGEEDEIVQKIELGEVNLSIPGTEFVSYSGQHEGLFGAKMSAQLGKLDVVAIASKEEGKSSGANFSGTSEADSLLIKDIQYKARTFYAIDQAALQRGDKAIQTVKVYVDDRNGANDLETGAQSGRASLWEEWRPDQTVPTETDLQQQGNFDHLVQLEDYLFDYETGIIEFIRPIASTSVLAVSYTRFDGYAVGGLVGGELLLKMLKKDDRVGGTAWAPVRRYEIRNVYDLGAEDIPEDGFQLTIRKNTASGEDPDTENGVSYIQILGLDTAGLGGDPTPDGLIDLQWIDFEKGYLVFPDFTPFCPDSAGFYYAPGGEPDPIYVADELEEKNCFIYSKEVFDPSDDVYYLQVEYNRPKTTFYLGQINIIENSEVVRLNGVRLTRGVDYTIYYPAGQLTLLNEDAKEREAKVTVEFDYKPFGLGGEKTLLGTRGVYNLSDNIQLGTTWMYQSKGTADDRPRLGEEPTRTIIGDMNVSAEFKPELMTWITDAIPLVDTDAESRLRISAETAVSMPEPNTKGFVTIDDMEGAESISMLGVSRRLWTPSSVPDEPGVVAADRMEFDWYNPDRKWREGDLFPYLPQQEADDTHTVLEFDYDAEGSSSWGGLMRLLSKTGNDYSDYQFLEFWVHDNGTRQGQIHIDLGTISEDFYPLDPEVGPNGTLDTEDVDRNGFDADEDTGLDTVEGEDGENVPGDDGDDDYSFTFGEDDYTQINGAEGNEHFDTEDLNGNWYLDPENRYWEFTIDLADTSRYLIQDNSVAPIPADKRTDWRLYRVPLGDAVSVGAIGDWTVIKSARVWLEGLPLAGDPIGIGSMDIVGSQWEPEAIRDSMGVVVDGEELGEMSFHIGTKSTKEDSDYANDPPFDPGRDEDTNLPKREQSLVLFYENLEGKHTATARKLFFTEENYTTYESLEFYVHGHDDVQENTVFFLRLGADTLNYYEYSLELREGWAQKAGSADRKLTIPFKSFTDLKLEPYAAADTASVAGESGLIQNETFTRIGWPSLSRVRRLTVGIRNDNDDGIGNEITGEIWIDDIQLTDVRKDIGWAERATIEAKFADLLDMDFDLRHVDGNFHSLKQTRGSGQDNLSYNFSGTLNADRFVSGLGISTPVSVTWKKSVSRPTFSTGSDIVLDAEESKKEKTDVLDRSFAASFSRKRQSPNFWTHLLIDGLSLRGSMSDHQRLAPTRADTSNTIRGRISYRYSPEKSGLRVFRNTDIFLKPTSFRFSAETHFIHNLSYDVESSGEQTRRTNTHDRKLNADANVDFQFLDNLRTSHSVSMKRDLAKPNRQLMDLNVGVETQRQYSNSLSFNPKFGKWLSPQYSFASSFTDNHGPEVRRVGDPPDVRDVRAQTTQDVRASFDLKKLVGPGGPSRSAPKPPSRDRRPPPEGQTESPDDGAEEKGDEDTSGEKGEGEGEEGGGAGIGDIVAPVFAFLRNMDAIEGRYSLKWNSRYDRVTLDEVPGLPYKLGFEPGIGADDRTEEQTIDFGSGLKLTNDIRVKGDYTRSLNGRWYKNTVAETLDLSSQTQSMNETSKASLSWNGVEKIGPLSGLFTSVRARSGVEYRRSYSGPVDEPTARGSGFSMSPIVSIDTKFKNGLTANFSWDKKRSRSHSLSGAGSVTEDESSSTSLTLKYRFSAPQGLKLPFFGQKLKFESNLDTSLTLRTSSKLTRTAQDEASLAQVDPSSHSQDFSVVADATYSFSRSVSGGLQFSFSQDRDVKREQTRRTIGMHLTAEFKF
jgi:hypothetical protein